MDRTSEFLGFVRKSKHLRDEPVKTEDLIRPTLSMDPFLMKSMHIVCPYISELICSIKKSVSRRSMRVHSPRNGNPCKDSLQLFYMDLYRERERRRTRSDNSNKWDWDDFVT